MEKEKKFKSPAAVTLTKELDEITRKAGESASLVSENILNVLQNMTPQDIEKLQPPKTSQGLWTDDTVFCKKLGCFLFGVSPETVNELDIGHYYVFLEVVSANFIRLLEVQTLSS